jgi:hypothetical protein
MGNASSSVTQRAFKDFPAAAGQDRQIVPLADLLPALPTHSLSLLFIAE